MMAKNLTNSCRDRQKILNDSYLILKVKKYFNLNGRWYFLQRISSKGELFFTKLDVECLLDTSSSIINKCIKNHERELKLNGYICDKNEQLQEKLKSLDSRFTKSIELFSFKALLNMAMLIPQSKPAQFMRSRILDLSLIHI